MLEKRVALVVGNGKYQNTSWLTNPPNDAAAISAALRRLDFHVLDGCDLTFADFAGGVRDFSRALREAHVALFFYAGHGLQVRGENYVVPVDAALEHEADVQLELIAVQTILAQMEVGNRTNLVILDACRNNPLARNLARAMGTRSSAIGGGLGRLESGIGTYIAFATSPNKVALDGINAANSPFTAALLRYIEASGLNIAEIMMQVRRDVIAATEKMREGPQVPWDSSSLTAPFYFRRSVQVDAHEAALPDPIVIISLAEQDWERLRIASTEHVPTIKAYIAEHQSSAPSWAARARQRLEAVQAVIAEQKVFESAPPTVVPAKGAIPPTTPSRKGFLQDEETVGLYWVGFTALLFIAVPLLFVANKWNWLGPSLSAAAPAESGLLGALVICVVSAAAIPHLRKAALNRHHIDCKWFWGTLTSTAIIVSLAISTDLPALAMAGNLLLMLISAWILVFRKR